MSTVAAPSTASPTPGKRKLDSPDNNAARPISGRSSDDSNAIDENRESIKKPRLTAEKTMHNNNDALIVRDLLLNFVEEHFSEELRKRRLLLNNFKELSQKWMELDQTLIGMKESLRQRVHNLLEDEEGGGNGRHNNNWIRDRDDFWNEMESRQEQIESRQKELRESKNELLKQDEEINDNVEFLLDIVSALENLENKEHP